MNNSLTARAKFVAHHVITEESVVKVSDVMELSKMMSALFSGQPEENACYSNAALGYLFWLLFKETENIKADIFSSESPMDIEKSGESFQVTVNPR